MALSVVQYIYLQLLDLLTTVAFLVHGVEESNPIVRAALVHTGNPMLGLVAVKLAGVLVGVYCWRSGRHRLLARINVWFAALVAWNLIAIIGAAVGRV